MEAKIPIVILANGMPFTFFATRTIIKAEQMTVMTIGKEKGKSQGVGALE